MFVLYHKIWEFRIVLGYEVLYPFGGFKSLLYLFRSWVDSPAGRGRSFLLPFL